MTTSTKKVTTLKFWVKIIVEKDGEGYYSYTPSLRGIHMGGDTPEEALTSAREAAALLLKTMIEDGDPIPIDVLEKPKKEKVAVSTPVKSCLEEILVGISRSPS